MTSGSSWSVAVSWFLLDQVGFMSGREAGACLALGWHSVLMSLCSVPSEGLHLGQVEPCVGP